MEIFKCSECGETDVDLSGMCVRDGCPKQHGDFTEPRFVKPSDPDVTVLHLEIPTKLLDDYEKAFGFEAVYMHNIEEAAEYIHAITKFCRSYTHERSDNVVEEAADLLICVIHLMRLLDSEDKLVTMFAEKQGKAIRNIQGGT